MNAAALILGLAGSVVTLIAVGSKSGGLRSYAAASAPPEPPEPLSLPSPRPVVDSIPSHAVEVVPEVPSTAVPVTSAPMATRAPMAAAKELLSFVSPLIHAGRTEALGTATEPSNIIRALQTDMRGLKADGIYGPKTQARGKELLGIEFPARAGTKRIVPKQTQPSAAAPKPAPLPPQLAELKPPPPPPPINVPVHEHSPKEAAEALWIYLAGDNPDRGKKGAPSEVVRAAQKDMGGGLKADGIYGPKTAARAKQLTGKAFPLAK